MVSETNAVSEELDKHRTFEVVLISAAAQEGYSTGDKTTKYVNNLIQMAAFLLPIILHTLTMVKADSPEYIQFVRSFSHLLDHLVAGICWTRIP